MIRLEGGVLVLDAPISKEDAQAVQEFAKHVREQETERIIKLLEEEFNDTWPTGVGFVETSLPNLIALIKGETNE